jgi:cation diffusion facilitator CzcD-associated flavoprotein CzcO
MLQRSPTYIVPWPAVDPLAEWFRRKFSLARAYKLTRAKNVLRGMYFYRAARKNPAAAKERLRGLVVDQLGPEARIDPDFTPTYNPWDQRLCLSPNADFFKAIRDRKVSVVTAHIDTFTETGIRLKSGVHIDADVIVTATGLVLEFLGGVAVDVDGRALHAPEQMVYKGCMFRDVPNLITIFGYVNASWTLKADLVSDYACRVINHLDAIGAKVAVPVDDDPRLVETPWTHFTSGYFQRGAAVTPKQGSRKPWTRADNYFADMRTLRFGRIDDGVLRFAMPQRRAGRTKPHRLEAAE